MQRSRRPHRASNMPWRFYVYAYFGSDVEVPFYVGKGVGSRLEEHWKKFTSGRKIGNRFLLGSFRKLHASGECPKIIKIASFRDEIDAYEFEAKLISTYGRKIDGSGILDNIDPGFWNRIGFKGKKHTPEAIAKMEGRKLSEQTRARMSKAKSEEHRKKLKNNGNNIVVKWQLADSTGQVFEVTNLSAFCKERSLNVTPIYRSLEKKTPVSRGASAGWQALSKVKI